MNPETIAIIQTLACLGKLFIDFTNSDMGKKIIRKIKGSDKPKNNQTALQLQHT